jgi:hypothetical protein
MGTFSASLKTLGDRRGLPATISLEEDMLSITAGDQEIGSWSLAEITLEPTAGGFRMGAEGEQILIDMPDKDGFAEELSRHNQKGRLRHRRRDKAPAKGAKTAKSERPHTPPSYQVPMSPTPTPVTTERAPSRPTDSALRLPRLAEARAPSPAAPGTTGATKPTSETPKQPLMSRVDGFLETAEDKWGSLMPTWFFTRVMFFVVVGAFLLMLIFPGAVSAFLLAAGMLLVILGAIVYTDAMLASRWLPGRMTPTHVLIFGVAILMFGVLLGVIAR